ncbi:hypothetical protein [Marininema halotolerans]|uniref:Uncharacterized protein n=1 Tax=Marininema halotolerans TaxID=1155944 RepID=A0A1I6R9D1_9BACL|nr:hypothetical protein [Marininema halotolerans]SFS61118.1 hypothetical protein SAMN05444972_104273 [Marininema halotolerans]
MSTSNFLVSISNDIQVQLYFSNAGSGVIGPGVLRFNLGILGNINEETGFVIPYPTIQALFDRTFGVAWNKRLLIERGQKVPESLFPPRFVRFIPSSENLARVVGITLAPIIRKRFNKNLTFVRVITLTNPGLIGTSATYFIKGVSPSHVKKNIELLD